MEAEMMKMFCLNRFWIIIRKERCLDRSWIDKKILAQVETGCMRERYVDRSRTDERSLDKLE